jgi:tetratricopeptide (TPR) repeat protein
MRKFWFAFVLVLIIYILLFYLNSCSTHETEVLIVATIHNWHRTNPQYSYVDIVRILDTYNPDVICVEIRPEDFRKRQYLREMVLATIYGLSHRKKVFPVDWWSGYDREERHALAKRPIYNEKMREVDSLHSINEEIAKFEGRYGIWKDSIGKYDYKFFNSKEFSNYIKECYKISIEVFEDSPFNLHYRTRNIKMLKLIKEVIRENQGRKIMVLTGCEHKHFFDSSLSEEENINVVDFSEILPLGDVDLTGNVSEFLETGKSLIYYKDLEKAEQLNDYFRSFLIPLVHGSNMDEYPSIIPKENIEEAKVILEEWSSMVTASPQLEYERGWYKFLRGDYERAIIHYKRVINDLDNIAKGKGRHDILMRIDVYRNLCFCYDMLGQREKAIECYKMGEAEIEKTPFKESKFRIYKNYKKIPYRPRSKRSKTE